ncbi:hypothetical protein [Deinococcus sp. Leaf326]|uniref:hypothetical protein n=1 Tax=Deinococcus sp. Leaf326 TaxID=1736338 RepID=UPI000701D427|nr:hypothetical protein [Deinococcus sp. Leaf326]KQR22873.1 hypothetical protein ASF71_06820 [Deinococcus sp. Leaf326]
MTYGDRDFWDEGQDYPELRPGLRPARSGKALPDDDTVKRLRLAITPEVLDAESARAGLVALAKQARRDFRMEPYDPADLPMADMTVIRTPLTMSRVNQAHASLFGALNVEPFASAEVDGGEAGDVAHHAALALSQELRDVSFPNTLSSALLDTVITGTGVLRDGVVDGRLDPDVVSIEDLLLSPHAPRNIEQCTMVAQQFTEPLRWVRDQALAGVYDLEAVKKLGSGASWATQDGAEVEKENLWLSQNEGWASRESANVDLLEVYIRVRPRPNEESEMWRVVCARQAQTDILPLRAERWGDGFPFTLLRIDRSSNVAYGVGFPNTLKDIQFANDMLNSAAAEADFAATAPMWEMDEMSSAGKLFKARAQQRGGAVRPRPGEIFWRRGTAEAVRAIHINPTPPAITQRMNQNEQYANVASITMTPMQTYRSATEHRLAQEGRSGKENMMLQQLREDLSVFLRRNAGIYRKYIARPFSDQSFTVQHGSTEYFITQPQWDALRWAPRGMTSQADQMLRMQASQEAMMIVDDYWQKLAPYSRLGQPAVVALYESRRMRLEALGVQEWVKLLGESPQRDPNVIPTGENAMVTSQMLLGMNPQAQGQQGMGMSMNEPVRGDGTVTSVPGGNPLPDAGGFN